MIIESKPTTSKCPPLENAFLKLKFILKVIINLIICRLQGIRGEKLLHKKDLLLIKLYVYQWEVHYKCEIIQIRSFSFLKIDVNFLSF
jgi:hypothetical protein